MAFQAPPATPQRPTPGAFVNTPAPQRPSFSRQASMSTAQPAPLPAPPQESAIERAARTINSMLDRDNRYPALEAYIGRELLVSC